jgi:dienelactone hydrolase
MRVFAMGLIAACAVVSASCAQVQTTKTIDNGGSGPYEAIAATEASLPDYVVYRPKNLASTAEQAGALPVVVFANGGCNDTSLPFERMLSEIASHGYIVIALGAMQNTLDDRPLNKSPNTKMPEAIDWISAQTSRTESAYHQAANLNEIAFAGQSCGGAQVLAMAADPRVDTYLMFNSGIGDMTMSEADRSSLKNVHGPIVYLIGGESDVAFPNAQLDYQRLNHVPVAFADAIDAGHSGTFEEPYGGSFARMALKWLDWQLKGESSNADVFLKADLEAFPRWTMKAKNFDSGLN